MLAVKIVGNLNVHASLLKANLYRECRKSGQRLEKKAIKSLHQAYKFRLDIGVKSHFTLKNEF
ncbi:MAG TPA: hypothetical protein VD908_08850 [Cytophagales bacterium]|nr:hypothetical protein [Cytophagales bacterium]